MVQKAAMDSSHLSIPHIVQKLSLLDCGCDKDRVNALFGIVGTSASWFSPGYDLPATNLFVEFAIGHMRHLRSFEILHFAGINDPTRHRIGHTEGNATLEIARPAEDLPSWVPDWRVRYRPLPIISAEHEALEHGRALLPFHLPSDWSDTTLTLTGKLLKTSTQPCGIPHLDLFNPEEHQQNQHSVDPWCNQMFVNYLTELDPSLGALYRHSPSFTHWLESAIHTGKDPKSLDNLVLRFARTLIMDGRVRSTEKQDSKVPRGKVLDYFREYAKLALVTDAHAASAAYTAMADDTASMEKVAAYGYLAEHICRYRTLFLGEGGLVGLGAVGISPSDRICFLFGLSTPFILHPKGNRFGLRGECYLDGHMNITFEDLEAEEVMIVLE